MPKYIAEIGNSTIPAKMVEAVEICASCGNHPQAPEWDQCFGCGKTHTLRLWVPAKECIETGITSPTGIRWTKWKEAVDLNQLQFGALIVTLLEKWAIFYEALPDGEYTGLGELRLVASLVRKRLNR